ncbi:hypothetical protein GLW08_13240 [Pontibacillus yanchengensis]|uniref:Uncharacterized protein n=2 Tax=Pontibacillus yanchengensis TaxID=462910 RepID=A0ACC7VH48_9BACI|nr:hypothetical protein [Pontibacillus yanchengensis]MYL34486.1 hypothetical protein [Pontibacillus yanchengensis]MYL54293.1 hypothetical protein [Pontibacillus yanchengensis]
MKKGNMLSAIFALMCTIVSLQWNAVEKLGNRFATHLNRGEMFIFGIGMVPNVNVMVKNINKNDLLFEWKKCLSAMVKEPVTKYRQNHFNRRARGSPIYVTQKIY